MPSRLTWVLEAARPSWVDHLGGNVGTVGSPIYLMVDHPSEKYARQTGSFPHKIFTVNPPPSNFLSCYYCLGLSAVQDMTPTQAMPLLRWNLFKLLYSCIVPGFSSTFVLPGNDLRNFVSFRCLEFLINLAEMGVVLFMVCRVGLSLAASCHFTSSERPNSGLKLWAEFCGNE